MNNPFVYGACVFMPAREPWSETVAMITRCVQHQQGEQGPAVTGPSEYVPSSPVVIPEEPMGHPDAEPLAWP